MTTYSVNYYDDQRVTHTVQFIFQSQFAAVYHARRIRDSYGYQTDVIDNNTGAILVYFDTLGRSFVDEHDIEPDARKIAALEDDC